MCPRLTWRPVEGTEESPVDGAEESPVATDLAAVEGTSSMIPSLSSSSPRFNAALATEDTPDLAKAPDLPEAPDLT